MGSLARPCHSSVFLFCLFLSVKGMTSPQSPAATGVLSSDTARTTVPNIVTSVTDANEATFETIEESTPHSSPPESLAIASDSSTVTSVSSEMESTLPRSESLTTAFTTATSAAIVSRRTSTSSTNHRTISTQSLVPSTNRDTISTTRTMSSATNTTVSTPSTENGTSTWTPSRPQSTTTGFQTAITTEPPRRPTPQVLSKSCPEDYVVLGQGSSCTCTTPDLGSPPGKLLWVDPSGAVVAGGEENQLDLDFSLVTEAYNRREYKCILRHRLWDWSIPYTPKIADRPGYPKILGFQKTYQAREEIKLECVVGGGIPDVKTVSFECSGHPDRPDTALDDGTVASNQSFIASVSDNSTQCVCQGTNDFLQSRENQVTVIVVAVQQPESDESLQESIIVEVIAATVGAAFTVVPPICVFLYRKKIRAFCQKRFGRCKAIDEEENSEATDSTEVVQKNTCRKTRSDSFYAKQLQKQFNEETELSRMRREAYPRQDTITPDKMLARQMQEAEVRGYREENDRALACAVEHVELSDYQQHLQDEDFARIVSSA